MTPRALRSVVVSTLALLLTAAGVSAQPPRFRLDPVSAWGGAVNAFVRVGDVGYCGSGQRVVVLDMTNEANPLEIASINVHATVCDLAAQGGYLYIVGTNPRPLTTVSIANPAVPVVTDVKTTASTPDVGNARKVRLLGGHAFVLRAEAGGHGYVHPFSLADPAHPVLVSALPAPTWYPRVPFLSDGNQPPSVRVLDLKVRGNLAYVAETEGYLRIYDVTNPLAPSHLGSVSPSPPGANAVFSVSLDGDHAVVQGRHTVSTTTVNFTALVDISSPTNPTQIGVAYTDWVGATNAALVGNYALVCDQWIPADCDPPPKGLAVIDFTNPNNPTYIGGYHLNYSDIRDVRVQGNRAYVSCMGEGLVVFDISNPAQPLRVGGYYSPGFLRDCAKEGDRLYVSDTWNGFTVLDASNPSVTPTVVGIYRTPEPCSQDHQNILVRNNIAYLAGGRSGVHIVNVDPLLPGPSFISKILPPGEVQFKAWCVALDGNVLHASTHRAHLTHPQELRLYDVSSPTNPQPPVELGRTDAGRANAMSSKDGYTHIGQAAGSPSSGSIYLDIYDCTNPAAPFPAGQIPEGAKDLAREGNILLTAKDMMPEGGMHILDVTNPVLPQRVALVPNDAGRSVGIQGSRAYFGRCGEARTLAVYDIGAPASPQLLAYTDAAPTKIHAYGDLVYTSSAPDDNSRWESQGMLVHRFICYANCDGSTTLPVLTIADFGCFLNKFAAGDAYANCDQSTAAPVLTIQDFGCFLNLFAAGCD